ncbi:SRPBCC domain-containing protein [Lacinutrix sp. MedPE-SW]|uniref:SRPBCC family protein n=1 Tax=Lacinutrix sp. MedPE-SW TaxID=1860087 RepID=UPI0009106680|nr:SRPBCC domain-containing protein [Lacinutrix sp. MedPE-SW]OIQ19391.1 MAG: ATPase [Lacinutrix sp. MedPE-SW]
MELKNTPIIVKQEFNTTAEKVWEAITNPDLMRQWYFNNIPDFKTEVGFKTEFIVKSETRVFPHIWEVTEVINLKKLSYSWCFNGYEGKSISTFEISPLKDKTKLTLTASIIEKFPENIPEFKRESGVAGWNYLIKESLVAFLNK